MQPWMLVRGAIFVLVTMLTPLGALADGTRDAVQAALDEMHAWVGDGEKGQGWKQFLRSDELSRQLTLVEGADPAAALARAGKRLGLYHAADSNRAGVGEGHIDFGVQIESLDAIGYQGPIILEVNAPGPNPFTPDKGEGFRDVVERQLSGSVERLRTLGA